MHAKHVLYIEGLLRTLQARIKNINPLMKNLSRLLRKDLGSFMRVSTVKTSMCYLITRNYRFDFIKECFHKNPLMKTIKNKPSLTLVQTNSLYPSSPTFCKYVDDFVIEHFVAAFKNTQLSFEICQMSCTWHFSSNSMVLFACATVLARHILVLYFCYEFALL